MDVRWQVSFTDKDEVVERMNSLGIKYERIPPKVGYLCIFYISESDPRWPEVATLIAEKRLFHGCFTVFTRDEVLAADWLRFYVTRDQGYPQPESRDRWREVTLDLDIGCPKCGVGVRQNNSVRIKKEPRPGKYGFMHPFWIMAICATPEVFEAFEAAGLRGYEKWPVIIHGKGLPAENVSQIYVPRETEPGLLGTEELKDRTELCRECGQTKFNAITRGRIKYRQAALPKNLDFVISHEWFGAGGFAFQEMFVSSRVARVVLDHGWKGVVLHPLELY